MAKKAVLSSVAWQSRAKLQRILELDSLSFRADDAIYKKDLKNLARII